MTSKSLITTSMFFIKKKNGFLHLVQDYRNFNILMIKNKYLLSLAFKLVVKLQDS